MDSLSPSLALSLPFSAPGCAAGMGGRILGLSLGGAKWISMESMPDSVGGARVYSGQSAVYTVLV